MEAFEWKKATRIYRSVLHRIRRKRSLSTASRIDGCDQGEDMMAPRAAKYSSLDIHEAVFASAPKTRSVEDLDEGIRSRMRHRHGRHRHSHMDPPERQA